jgi:hypothetical protein
LISRLDQATQSTHAADAAKVELAYDLLAFVGSWIQECMLTGQVDGQLELPLEWAESRAGR